MTMGTVMTDMGNKWGWLVSLFFSALFKFSKLNVHGGKGH